MKTPERSLVFRSASGLADHLKIDRSKFSRIQFPAPFYRYYYKHYSIYRITMSGDVQKVRRGWVYLVKDDELVELFSNLYVVSEYFGVSDEALRLQFSEKGNFMLYRDRILFRCEFV